MPDVGSAGSEQSKPTYSEAPSTQEQASKEVKNPALHQDMRDAAPGLYATSGPLEDNLAFSHGNLTDTYKPSVTETVNDSAVATPFATPMEAPDTARLGEPAVAGGSDGKTETLRT